MAWSSGAIKLTAGHAQANAPAAQRQVMADVGHGRGVARLNADVAALPVRDSAFNVVLAVHMLYHVPGREAAVGELRRVLASGGVCIAVTNGARHTCSLRALVERAVRTRGTWLAHAPGDTHVHRRERGSPAGRGVVPADASEARDQVRGLNWPACPGGEHQVFC
jgi:SAM-dependent methyltransferase